MELFSNCKGKCCVCAHGIGFCLAGLGDDYFEPASKEVVIKNLNNWNYLDDREYMIKYLHDKYNYQYENK